MSKPQTVRDIDVGIDGNCTITGLKLPQGRFETAEANIFSTQLKLKLDNGVLDISRSSGRPSESGSKFNRSVAVELSNTELSWNSTMHFEIDKGVIEIAPQGVIATIEGSGRLKSRHATVAFSRLRASAFKSSKTAIVGSADIWAQTSKGSFVAPNVTFQMTQGVVQIASTPESSLTSGKFTGYISPETQSMELEFYSWPLSSINLGGSQLSGSITGALKVSKEEEFWVGMAQGALTNLKLESDNLAKTTTAISPDFSFVANYSPAEDFLQVRPAEVAIGNTNISLSLDASVSDGSETIWLQADLPSTSCHDLYLSAPASVRSTLSGLQLTGRIEGKIKTSIDFDNADSTTLEFDIDNDCQATREPSHADTKTAAKTHTTRTGRKLPISPHPQFVPIKTLPSHVYKAFVSGEDAAFFVHNGFDTNQLERSLRINVDQRKMVRGGSTISQQLVKNLFLSPNRSVSRKLQEVILTWRLEANTSKMRILEQYLNVIELAPDTFGLYEGAEYWFDKPASLLTLHEAAFLAALTPAPTYFSKRLNENGRVLQADLRERVNVILRAMARNGYITWDDYRRLTTRRLKLHQVQREA